MKLKFMLPYLVVNAIAFYLLPLLIQNTGIAMFVMLIGIPLVCFLVALVYGIKNGLNWLYPFMVAILFIPTIFIFYNYTAWVYIVGYGVIALIGNFVGKLFYKNNKQSL